MENWDFRTHGTDGKDGKVSVGGHFKALVRNKYWWLTLGLNFALNAMSGDVVEYGEWQSGVRSDGIVFSSSSFSMKVAMGVSSAAIAWVLGASGYDGSRATQSAVTVSAMVNTFVWVPVSMVVVMAALLFFYDLDGRIGRIGRELAARRE